MQRRLAWLVLGALFGVSACRQIAGIHDIELLTDASRRDADEPPEGEWCASLSPQPTFCADFDVVTTPQEGWDMLQTQADTTLGLDGKLHVSAPESLLAYVSHANGNGSAAQLIKSFPMTLTHAQLDFELYSETYTDVSVAAIQLSSDDSPVAYLLELYIQASGSYLQEQVPADGGMAFPASNFAPPPASPPWLHVTLVMDLPGGGPGGTVNVSYNGTIVHTHKVTASNAYGRPTLHIGAEDVFSAPNGTVWMGNFDNVTFDVR
jgi:hypothetical protein